jgi:hypothetical protein
MHIAEGHDARGVTVRLRLAEKIDQRGERLPSVLLRILHRLERSELGVSTLSEARIKALLATNPLSSVWQAYRFVQEASWMPPSSAVP